MLLPPSNQRTLGECLSNQAAIHQNKEFLVFGKKSWTYIEFDEWVTVVAGGLLALGLRKGDKLAIMLPNCPEFMVLWFACARIGVVEVPVNTAYRGSLLRYVLEHSDSRMAVVAAEYLDRIQHDAVGFGKLEKLVLWAGEPLAGVDLPIPAVPFEALSAEAVPLPPAELR